MISPSGKRLYIQEVAVRDGFQIEPKFIPTEQKIDLVNRLSRTGLAKEKGTSCHPELDTCKGMDAIWLPFELSIRSVNSGEPDSRLTQSEPSYLWPVST